MFLFYCFRALGITHAMGTAAVKAPHIIVAGIRGVIRLPVVAACLCFVAPRGCVSIVLTVFAQFGFAKEWVHFGIGSFTRNVDAVWNGFLVKCDQES